MLKLNYSDKVISRCNITENIRIELSQIKLIAIHLDKY